MTVRRSLLIRAVAVLLSAAAGFALTGCGGNTPSTSASTSAGPSAPAPSYPAEVERGSTLHIYSWADYIAPENITAFEAQTGVMVQVDTYASADEAVAKLRLTQGTGGYDLVVMDGSYVPQLEQVGALAPWDKARLPGMAGLSPTFLAKSWDPTNSYAIPKSGGSTGFVWDSKLVTVAPTDWNSFYRTFADPAVAGKTSVIDGAPSFVGSYFWGNQIPDQTTNPDDYAAAESFLASSVLPHLKRFSSYPRAELASGEIVLGQAFTGDARGALIDGPKTLRFALGGPKTDIYVDHWVLPKGTQNPAAAHAFVQFLLDPDRAAAETLFHGYNTGVLASRAKLPKDLPFPEIIFFDEGQPADRFVPATVTPEARKLANATFQRLKAKAST